LLLMSLKAGGVGLNLPEATTVILFDRWWNPALEEQAIARADRFGRKNILHIFKFIVTNSIEERIDELLKEKESLFEDIVEGTAEIVNKLSLKEITNILE
jgi:SNF2 family DNA or RNA helicase